MFNQIFSPTDQLKLKALKNKLENRDKDLYLVSVNTQNLYREFIEFFEKVTDSNEFVIYKLYQKHNIEEQINTIQFHRDGLIDDEKAHIFLVDRDEWSLFTSKGDLFNGYTLSLLDISKNQKLIKILESISIKI